ncbi:MAG: energy-coupling factor transporter transmembrane component T family protein [Bacillota bacterium]|uniref:Energy-coupling factor transporter transmembrane protein EcfT n=1 Tax=Thermanaerosceptrum fracticalcis TaxID=1712410 RepID=A0A7G6E167_THEFR|nr:energy-coupling factor transporter transmembrane component T [Thermanaerosceptrum fracticalcis]QNB45821.1 energy-coupling factor transporter transmembrane protein EcfT [Thermanaerosceptrum fracticalcis]
MFIYRERDNLIYRIHPLTSIFYIFTIALLSLVFSHPVFLLALFLALGMVIVSAEITREWVTCLKFSLGFILIIIMVNCLFVRAGTTVLLVGPVMPGIGKIRITLEALCYGAGMGLRFFVIISAFCLYTHAVHPDKVLKLLGKWGNKTVLALSLATRLFPLMTSDFQRIMEVQRCRGVNFQENHWQKKLKKLVPVINIMLLSSLERSFQLAESMQVRGYGLGKRSHYTEELWHPRDILIITFVAIGIIMGTWLVFAGWTSYRYYPRLQPVDLQEIVMAGFLSIFFIFPACLNWGWKKWPLLKSRI